MKNIDDKRFSDIPVDDQEDEHYHPKYKFNYLDDTQMKFR